MSTAAAILIVATLLTVVWWSTRKNDPRLNRIPTPPHALPILGHALQFASTQAPTQLFNKWAWEYGPLVRVNLFGMETLLISDPNLISTILRRTETSLKPATQMIEALRSVGLGKALVVFQGSMSHRRVVRKLVEQPFSPAQVSKMQDSIVGVGLQLREDIRNEIARSQLNEQTDRMAFGADEIDLMRLFKKTAFGAMMVLAFDMKYEEYSKMIDLRDMERITNKISTRVDYPFRYWKYFKTQSDRECDESVKRVEAAADYFIKHSMEKPDRAEANLLRGFLANQSSPDGEKVDYDMLVSNVIGILVGAFDTTSNTLYSIVHWLAREPRVQEKIQREVDAVLKNAARIEDIANLDPKEAFKYVYSVIREANRITPFVFATGHVTTQDMDLGSVTIPKDITVILMNTAAMLKSSSFEDKFEFRPERWDELDSNDELRKKELFSFRPFSGGAHICPGRHLAIAEVLYFIVILCSEFEITYKPAPEYVRIFARTPLDLPLQIRKRNNKWE
ncbi:cytochrome P450 [Cladochytrium replicatum]|nr:cytochrome P450 [Cladochytrium replicatum]